MSGEWGALIRWAIAWKNYLRFADLNDQSWKELSRKVLGEAAVNKDKFGRVAKDGLVDGGIGLDCLIELYRGCAEAIRPLLRMVSEAVATAEGKEHPDRSLGLNKRVELIHKSGYSDLVD